ncbi:MAG: hypothetical protein IKT65_08275 [Clostridia bacterium]|nr:hypothetical protein [Clostridia bacterium]
MNKRSFYERIARFMYGRNGSDDMCRGILILCAVLIVVNLFFRSFIISAIELALIAYATFRMLSKNVVKRRQENQKYKSFENKIKQYFLQLKNRFRDRKTHVYRKCPACKSTLRLPKVKGSHSVNCPRCKKSFHVKI